MIAIAVDMSKLYVCCHCKSLNPNIETNSQQNCIVSMSGLLYAMILMDSMEIWRLTRRV